MSKIRGLVLAVQLFCVASLAMADALEDYRALFGEEELKAAQQAPKVAVEFAAKCLAAAKSTQDQKDLQAILCNRAYEYGMKAPAGYPTAVEAMKLLLGSGPDHRDLAQKRLIRALQTSYLKSAGKERSSQVKELLDLLMACGDECVAARQPAEALAFYRNAKDIAASEKSAQAGEIAERIKRTAAAQESERKKKDFKARLDAAPTNAAVRMDLIVACLGEFDDPQEAAKLLTAEVDAKVRANVLLAAGKLEDVTEAASLELARWYMELADKASPAGKSILLRKAGGCCDHYLALHTTQDAALLKGQMLQQQVQQAITKLGAPRGARELTLDLGGKVTMKLLLIPSGRFNMGSPQDEKDRGKDEGPQREVAISRSFYMGVYEVTQEQYEQIMGKNPSEFKNPKHPVEMVALADAVEFCNKASQKTGKTVRLPTEAEWEYACRAGTKTRYGFGDKAEDLPKYGNYLDKSNTSGFAWQDKEHSDGFDKTAPVGSFKPNGWGLYDMHGNVCELCSDWYGDYAGAKTIDPQGPASGPGRLIRGGGWVSGADCRSALRYGIPAAYMNSAIGFRVVVEAK